MRGSGMPISRRSMLTTGLGVGMALLAGCASGTSSPSESTPTPPERSVFRQISFEGQDLVVQLREDHDISKLNLIAPDESLFGQTTVPEGTTTARMQLLDIEPDGGGYEHYTPGTHELVAISEADSESIEIELEPALEIVEVRQYRTGEQANDYGKLAVVVENTGTAPTWIHHITYKDAPNFAANDALAGDPGVLLLEHPSTPKETVILPEQRQTFVGVGSPFLFTDQNGQTCHVETELTILVETAVGDPLEQRIYATVDGEIKSAGLTGEFTCTEISIRLIGDE